MTDSSTEQPDNPDADNPDTGTDDDLLPEDLRASEDNPLAEPLSEEETPDDPDELEMRSGKESAESEETDTNEGTNDGTNDGDTNDGD